MEVIIGMILQENIIYPAYICKGLKDKNVYK